MKVSDLEKIEGINFFDIKSSKTVNSIRKTPIHSFTYKKIIEHIKENHLKSDDYIFTNNGVKAKSNKYYRKAYIDMGAKLGKTEEELRLENIHFYSGRHFWKTLMSSEELGTDIEELFMGHKVSSDVSKLYNHNRQTQSGSQIAKS
ncbi:MAG: hypothetical protein Ta2C_10940 [Candidatus Endomicrobiellum trichonymphae]|nr:MAG: hypothetical protein Ta2C_10940 [Candidatus Endomicrobium trichonymphae]